MDREAGTGAGARDCGIDPLCPRFSAKFGPKIGAPLHALGRDVGIEKEGVPMNLDVVIGKIGDRRFQPPFADIAPRADSIENDVDPHDSKAIRVWIGNQRGRSIATPNNIGPPQRRRGLDGDTDVVALAVQFELSSTHFMPLASSTALKLTF